MQTLTQTASGEIVENINGVIHCQNTAKNWATVADWVMANDQVVVLIKTNGKYLLVDLCGFSAPMTESLLEHFEHQI